MQVFDVKNLEASIGISWKTRGKERLRYASHFWYSISMRQLCNA